MKCAEVQERFSQIHDKELSPEEAAQALTHIHACPSCEKELASYQKISALSKQLTSPQAPPHLWDQIQTRLTAPNESKNTLPQPLARQFSRGRLALAASLLIALGIGTGPYVTQLFQKPSHLAANFSRYLDEFLVRPEVAQQILLASYGGRPITLGEAERVLGYTPVVARGLPPGYSLQEIHLLDMPCCTCAQVLCSDEAGNSIAIFEHAIDQPIWFGDRPTKECLCHQVPTSVKSVGDRLAATWKEGDRYVTLIGASNLSEVSLFVDQFQTKNSS